MALCYTFHMKPISYFLFALTAATAATVEAASPAAISIEIVTERGVQSTAHRQWLQLLASIGQRDISIRSIRAGEQADIRNTGTPQRPRYRIVGVLDASGTLTLPGGKFQQRSRSQLSDYLDRLANDGPEDLTAKKGRYGLTKKQFEDVHAELSQTLEIPTQGRRLGDLLREVADSMELELSIDSKAQAHVERAEPLTDETKELTFGTALALLLRRDGLVLVPEKSRGKEVQLRVARLADVAPVGQDASGKEYREEELAEIVWPVGWKSDAQRRQLAPAMMEYLNAQIEGFTLAEAMDTIAPRTGVPIFWDHSTLRKHQIDPTTVEVKYPKKRSQLIRVIDRLLFQARLRGELKVDEAGTVFYWISR